MHFKDKVVLISGATGGIGAALAHQLAQEHCNLALFARREGKLKEITNQIAGSTTTCIYKKCDVKQEHDVKEAVAFTIAKYGKIDIALLTAGVLNPNPIETFDTQIIKESMEINFLGNIYFVNHLIRIMKQQQAGTIAAVSTLPDRRGIPGWGAYGASKAALSWFMESLRAEAKQKYNINIITIKPGSVKTPMIQDYHRPGSIYADKAAELIIQGIKKGKKIIQFPLSQVVMIRIRELFPVSAYDLIPVEELKGEDYPKVDKK